LASICGCASLFAWPSETHPSDIHVFSELQYARYVVVTSSAASLSIYFGLSGTPAGASGGAGVFFADLAGAAFFVAFLGAAFFGVNGFFVAAFLETALEAFFAAGFFCCFAMVYFLTVIDVE
jgi:hypothetical protein